MIETTFPVIDTGPKYDPCEGRPVEKALIFVTGHGRYGAEGLVLAVEGKCAKHELDMMGRHLDDFLHIAKDCPKDLSGFMVWEGQIVHVWEDVVCRGSWRRPTDEEWNLIKENKWAK